MKSFGSSLKRLLAGAAAAVMLAPSAAYAAYTPNFDPTAQGAYLVNLDTGQVIYEKNPDQRYETGYLAKLMTALVTVEYMEEKGLDLDAETAPLKLYIQNLVYGSANLGGILQGEEVSIRGLLYSMLLQSANEATLMLGDYIGDESLGHFADMMDEKARELGCTQTDFADPAGFHDEDPAESSWTTPREMALIFQAVVENDLLLEMLQTRSYDIGPTNVHDSLNQFSYTNAMMSSSSEYYYAPVEAGFISAVSGEEGAVVSMASSQGYRYLLVLLGIPATGDTRDTLYRETIDLYQWAFDSFSVRTVMEKGEIVQEIPLRYSFESDYMPLETGEAFMTLMPNEVDLTSIQYRYDLPEAIAAPVDKGVQAGWLRLVLADEEIGAVPLLTTRRVEASGLLTALGWVQSAVHTFWFKFLLLFAITFIVLYTALLIQVNKRKRRRGKFSKYNPNRGRYL